MFFCLCVYNDIARKTAATVAIKLLTGKKKKFHELNDIVILDAVEISYPDRILLVAAGVQRLTNIHTDNSILYNRSNWLTAAC